jgi:hypothetical protein
VTTTDPSRRIAAERDPARRAAWRTIRDRETTVTNQAPPKLSEYDFLELVAFDAKVKWETFSYAYEEYPPRFEAPELRELATHYSRLKALWLANREAIDAFWQQPGAMGIYDRHLDAADRRSRRRS